MTVKKRGISSDSTSRKHDSGEGKLERGDGMVGGYDHVTDYGIGMRMYDQTCPPPENANTGPAPPPLCTYPHCE